MRLKGIWWQPIGDAVLPVAVEIHLTKFNETVRVYHYPLTDQHLANIPRYRFYVTSGERGGTILTVKFGKQSNIDVNINSQSILSKVKDILNHKYD